MRVMLSVCEIPGPQPGLFPSTPYQELEVVLHEHGIDSCVRVRRRLDWPYLLRVEYHL